MTRRYGNRALTVQGREQIAEHLEYKKLAQGIDKARRADPRWYQRYLAAQSRMEHDLKKAEHPELVTEADRALAHKNRDAVRRILKEKGIIWNHG